MGALLKPNLYEDILPYATANPAWRFTIGEVTALDARELESLGKEKDSDSAPMVIVMEVQGNQYILKGADEIAKPGAVSGFVERVRMKRARRTFKSMPVPV